MSHVTSGGSLPPYNPDNQDTRFAQGGVAAMLALLGPKFAKFLEEMNNSQVAMISASLKAVASQANSALLSGITQGAMSLGASVGAGYGAVVAGKTISAEKDIMQTFSSKMSALDKDVPSLQMKMDEPIMPLPGETEEGPVLEVSRKDEPLAKKDTTSLRKEMETNRDSARKVNEMANQRAQDIAKAVPTALGVLGEPAKAASDKNSAIQGQATQMANTAASQAQHAKDSAADAFGTLLNSARDLMSYGSSMVRG